MNTPDPSIGYDGWSRVMGTIGKEPAVKVPVRRPKPPEQLALPNLGESRKYDPVGRLCDRKEAV